MLTGTDGGWEEVGAGASTKVSVTWVRSVTGIGPFMVLGLDWVRSLGQRITGSWGHMMGDQFLWVDNNGWQRIVTQQ